MADWLDSILNQGGTVAPSVPVIGRASAPSGASEDYAGIIEQAARAEGVDPALMLAMAQQESAFNPNAVSSAGAVGLGQLMPATAERFGVSDRRDPYQNARGMAQYVRFLNDRYQGDVDKVLAGYNAGEGNVDKYGGIPPFAETQDYVKRIRERLGGDYAPAGADWLDGLLQEVAGGQVYQPPERQAEPGIISRTGSALGELGKGIIRGVEVTGPEMMGKTAQFAGERPSAPNEDWVKTGEDIVKSAQQRLQDQGWLKPSSTDPYSLEGAAGQAGEMLAPSMGLAMTGAAIGSLAGPVGTVVGGAAGFLASLPLFFGSQAQETYEKGIAAGLSKEQAYTAGVETGAIEAGGEGIADLVTGRLFRLLPAPVKKDVVRAATKALRSPWQMVKDLAGLTVAETGTEVAQGVSQKAVEAAHGISEAPTLDDATQVIFPTALLTVLTFGAGETIGGMRRKQVGSALADPTTPTEKRIKAAQAVHGAVVGEDPDVANQFLTTAIQRIQAGKPVIVENDAAYRLAAAQPADGQQPVIGRREPTIDTIPGVQTPNVAYPEAGKQAATPESAPIEGFDLVKGQPLDSFAGVLSEQNAARQAQIDAAMPEPTGPTYEVNRELREQTYPTRPGPATAQEVLDVQPTTQEVTQNAEGIRVDQGPMLGRVPGGQPEVQPLPVEGGGNLQQQASAETGNGKFGGAQESAQEQAPVVSPVEIDLAAHGAATSPLNNLPEPTEAQKEAGNYRKGSISINGLDISIENPEGSKRRPEWLALKNHYGYIKGTVGKDKDHLDTFLTDNAGDAALPVFVVDQIDPATGKFDEHKVILGAASEDEARSIYQQNYVPGWQGLGAVKQFSLPQFKDWLKGDTTRPVALQETPAVDRRASGRSTAERRKDQATRKKVADMSDAEKTRALLVDDLTGLGNRRAYEESDKQPIQVSIDLDGLKYINDTFGHLAGDAFLAAFGEQVQAVTGDGVHLSGDEFVVQAVNESAARRLMQEIESRAATAEIEVTLPDGSTKTLTGIGFSYGIAQDIGTADIKLRAHKEERERLGLRGKRGEQAPDRAITGAAAGEQDNVGGGPQGKTSAGPQAPVEKSAKKAPGRKKQTEAASQEEAVALIDPRLKREAFRFHLQKMAGELQKGGGIGYIRDQNGVITGRTPSANPAWFQSMAETPETRMSVEKVKAAVQKVLEGKTLGIREARVVIAMLDTISGERTDPRNMSYVLERLAKARALRNAAGLYDSADWAYTEDEYPDEADGTGRALLELMEEAKALGISDEAETIMESQADDAIIADRMAQLIKDTKDGRTSQTRAEEVSGEPEARTQAKEEDLAGPVSKTAQAVADAERAKDEKRRGTQDVPVESGEFFGQGGKLEPDLFKAPSVPKNTLFTEDAAAKARELLRKKIGQVSTGIDPEILQAGITLAGYHIEKGARTFAAYTKAMVDDLGEIVRPYLKSWYNALRDYPGFDPAGMDSYETVSDAKLRAPTAKTLATRLHAILGAFSADSNTPEGAARADIRGVLEELERHKGRIATKDLVAILERASNLLLRNFNLISEGVQQVADDLAKQIAPVIPDQPDDQKAVDDVVLDMFVKRLKEGPAFTSITQARQLYGEMDLKKPEGETLKRVDELMERAVVLVARDIVAKGDSAETTYEALVDLYKRQPNLSTRTSTSIENQAYSTPAPLAYVADTLAQVGPGKMVLESTAGNGMLLIGVKNTKMAVVNELDPARQEALRAQGFTVTGQDASALKLDTNVDAVVINPPFGTVKEGGVSKEFTIIPGKYKTTEIDHAIVFQSLKYLNDDGTAVLLVGGLNKQLTSDEARSDGYNGAAKRKFYYHLYNTYNVVDHFTVAGELYQKQGAGLPVDVIVIRGKGKSSRALPAVDVPKVYNTWESLKSFLEKQYEPNRVGAVGVRPGTGGIVNPVPAGPESGPGSVPVAPVRSDTAAGGSERGPAGSGELPALDAVRGGVAGGPGRRAPGRRGQPTGVQQPGPRAAPGRLEPAAESAPVKPARVAEGTEPAAGRAGRPVPGAGELGKLPGSAAVADASQTSYIPSSNVNAIGTLVPVNMQTATSESLQNLQDRVGPLDDYIAKALDYRPGEVGDYFAAEQVDALALALDQLSRGKGFIIGDQTGVGKGRVVAGMIRYALKQGLTPIFVTEKPNLYADMYRDLTDIGMTDIRPIMTNAGEKVPLTDDGNVVLKNPGTSAHNARLQEMADEADLGEYNIIFTTYNQMQTVKEARTARMNFLEAFAQNGMVIFDESHNAGGQDQESKRKGQDEDDTGTKKTGRAAFARGLVQLSKGTFYSSATYAKRPEVMDLYAKTDMALAVGGDVRKLASAIKGGGVPLQQVVASMLTRAGQYVRRERSFEGVEYSTLPVAVDRQAAETIARVMLDIKQFSDVVKASVKDMDKDLKADAKKASMDGSTGDAGASSTNFTSIMHNLIDQMLLALKADAAADEAIAALEAGEKPVITVANTMGSFIDDYASDANLTSGDQINLSFRDLMRRYLDRSREIRIKDANGNSERYPLSDEELGPMGVAYYERIVEMIGAATALQSVPISPIDWIHARLRKAGYKTGEITGRNQLVDYTTEGLPVYRVRPARETSIAGRRATITGFNSGKIDAVILNQAGATGLSLHASQTFKDQRRRAMLIAQPERNIDTHMQMLGRVHRTGQVIAPRYAQLVADIPAEKRPAAVLARKMASLNANTTAARSSRFTSADIVDFINDYGDEVVAQLMVDMPEVHTKLGEPLHKDENGYVKTDAARKVTGRIPMLPVAEQESLYDMIEQSYKEHIERADAMGENALEAKTLALDAKAVKRTVLFEAQGAAGPFADGAYAETVDVKRMGKPYTAEQVRTMVAEAVNGTPSMSIDELGRLGQQERSMLVSETNDAFQMYRTAEENKMLEQGLKDQAREGRLGALDGQHTRWNDTMRRLYIGGQYEIVLPDGTEIYGVVTKITRKNGVKMPVAMGSWTAQIAVADGARTMTFPFSKIDFGARPADATGKSIYLTPRARHALKGTPVMDLFDDGQTQSREERIIITGNLLAGYSKVNGGQITHFTTADGQVQQGILMPRRFNLKDFAVVQPIKLTPEQVLAFLDKVPGRATSTDGIVYVAKTGDRYLLATPKAKGDGGRYYLDRDLRAITGDFNSSANSMRVLLDRPTLLAALQHINRKWHQDFQTDTFRTEAKQVGGVSIGQEADVTQTPKFSRGGGKGTPAAEIRTAITPFMRKLALGNSFVAPVEVVDDYASLPPEVESRRSAEGVDIEGVYWNGRVYLVASQIASPERARTVLFDHELRHLGLRKLFGEDLVKLLRSAWFSSEGPKIRQFAAERKIDTGTPNGKLEAAEEYIVNLAETGKDTSLWHKFVAIVRDFLRKFGVQLDLSDSDLRAIVAKAGKPETFAGPTAGVGVNLFSREAPVFYSQMQRVLAQKLPGSGSAAQFQQAIEAYAKKGEFKAEELEWSGVQEWFSANPGRKVTNDEVLEFLRANEIQVQEVFKGGDLSHDRLGWMKRGNYHMPSSEFGNRLGRVEELPNGKFVYDLPGGTRELYDTLQEAKDRLLDVAVLQGVDDRKFQTYVLPGGENYRELLFILPISSSRRLADSAARKDPKDWTPEEREAARAVAEGTMPEEFRSTHFPETKNIIAHVRFNERTDADGKRVLFIEEVQSDWMQKGRKSGFKNHARYQELNNKYRGGRASQEEIEEMNRLQEEQARGVPNAPFKTTWPLLAMKRMIRLAAENGFNRIAWTTGEQQAERYDLSKRISQISYDGKMVRAWDLNNEEVIRERATDETLPNVIGKEAAEKILAQPDDGGTRFLAGLDLKVGGEGMKGFYDQILPKEVGKYVKKWGAKVGKTTIDTIPGGAREMADVLDRQENPAYRMAEVHSVDITNAMRDAALAGQPLFARTPRTPDELETTLWDELRFKAQDKFHYLNKLEQGVAYQRGIQELPEAEATYLAELRYHGMAGAAIEDFEHEHVDPLLQVISDNKLALEDVELYLRALHAPEANAQLQRINPERENNEALSGMSNDEATDIINRLYSPAMEEISRRVQEITQARRDLLVDSGLETQATIDAWENAYQHYVPLKREGFVDRLPSKGKGFNTRGKEKRRAGSEREVVHVLANVVAQYEATAIKAEKVKVGKAFLEFARNNPNPDMYAVDKVEYKPSFDAEGLVTYRPQASFVLADNVLTVRENGVEHHITFNQQSPVAMRIAHALNNLGADETGPIVNMLSTLTRWLAVVNTGANPEFIISNFARDLQTAGYNLSATEADGLKWKIIKDVGKAWRGIRAFQKGKPHAWSPHFDEFRKAGAQTGWLQSYGSIEAREKDLLAKVEAMRNDKSGALVKRAMNGIIQFIEDENTAVENAIRLSTFVHARRAGLSEAKAAKIAKEMTVNFNRKGDMGQTLNALYLFYNASIQGTVRLLQAVAKSPKVQGLAAATVVFSVLLDIMNRALGGDDDDGEARYDKIPDFVKERNLIIMRPEGKGDYIKIPLPWGYNVLHVIGQAIGENLTRRNPDPAKSALRVAAATLSAFNPVGGTGSILQTISPTITDPLVQWAENKDWSGRPLRPANNPFGVDTPQSQKYWGSVRTPSKWVAEQLNSLTGGNEVRPGAIDISPEAIDLLIDTFTGGAGKFLTDIVSTPAKAIEGELVETYEIPLLRKVYGAPGMGTVVSDFYERMDAVQLLDKELKHYRGDSRKTAELRTTHRGEWLLLSDMRAAQGQLRLVRKQIKQFEKMGNEPALKAAREREKAIMQRFNKAYNEKMLRFKAAS